MTRRFMTITLALALLGTAFIYGCKSIDPGSDLANLRPRPPADTLSDEKVIQALNALGADRPDFAGPHRCAGACHTESWHGVITKQLVTEDWAQPTLKVKTCFDQAANDREKIRCFHDGENYLPKELGVYRAGAKYAFFQDMFRGAFPEAEQYNEEYGKFLRGSGSTPAALMPSPSENENATAPMSEEEFKNVIAVYTHRQGIEKMAAAFAGGGTSEDVCTSEIKPELERHVDNMQFEGWGPRLLSEGISMYGCNYTGDFDPLLSPVRQCFQTASDDVEQGNAQWNSPYDVEWAKGWDKAKGSDGRFLKQSVRILSDFNGLTTTFWMRSSADGRFVGNGLQGSARIEGSPDARGFIIDLQDSRPGNPTIVGVDAPYDPGFFPDNSGFTFISDGSAHFCSQKLLLPQPGEERRNFVNLAQEDRFCSDGRLGVYQHVGANLTGESHYVVVRSDNYANDDGGNSERYTRDPDVSKFARASSFADLYRMCQSSKCDSQWKSILEQEQNFEENGMYSTTNRTRIGIPFEGDFGISPSGKLLSSRISSQDGERQIGYRLRTYDLESAASADVGTLCMKGGKASISYNERIMVTHHYTDETDWQEFNTALRDNEKFSGASDPRFAEYVRKTSNIWMADLKSGKTYRITFMNPGQYALYPHFRADGWLYFLVRDKNQNRDFLVATDAAIRIQKN